MVANIQPSTALRTSIMGTGAALIISNIVVNAGNYAGNLLLSRFLGPAHFAELTIIVTVMLVLAMISEVAQMVIARFSASYIAATDAVSLASLYTWAGRGAWMIGAMGGVLLTVGAPMLASALNLSSVRLLLILALSLPWFVRLGVERGMLQGAARLGELALTYQAEMWIRFGGGLALVAMGFSVDGAVVAIGCGLAVAWLVARTVGPQLERARTTLAVAERRRIVAFVGPSVLAQLGNVLLSSSGMLMAGYYLSPVLAGQYAGVALIGRAAYFVAMPVTLALFPIVVARHQRGEAHYRLFCASLMGVGACIIMMIGVAYATAPIALNVLLGASYSPIAPLLWIYFVVSGLHALANLIIAYRLALGEGHGAWIALICGIVQIALISSFHQNPYQIVMAQMGATALLLMLLMIREIAAIRPFQTAKIT